jgi:hypothetical protein
MAPPLLTNTEPVYPMRVGLNVLDTGIRNHSIYSSWKELLPDRWAMLMFGITLAVLALLSCGSS